MDQNNNNKTEPVDDQSQKMDQVTGKTNREIETVANGIIAALRTYDMIAKWLRRCYIFLGIIAIIGSVFVTSFLHNPDFFYILPFISATSTSLITIITAFNLVGKSNNARNAWRTLQLAADRYNAGLINIEELIIAKSNAENTLGGVDFQFTLKKD